MVRIFLITALMGIIILSLNGLLFPIAVYILLAIFIIVIAVVISVTLLFGVSNLIEQRRFEDSLSYIENDVGILPVCPDFNDPAIRKLLWARQIREQMKEER
jgi:hypothetical protein